MGHAWTSAATVFTVKADTCTSTQTHYTNNYTASQIPAKAAAMHNSLPHNSYISKRGCFCWFALCRGVTVTGSVARWETKDLRNNIRLNMIIFCLKLSYTRQHLWSEISLTQQICLVVPRPTSLICLNNGWLAGVLSLGKSRLQDSGNTPTEAYWQIYIIHITQRDKLSCKCITMKHRTHGNTDTRLCP